MRSSLLASIALVTALCARGGEARAQIWMSRGSDGSLHFTNVAAQRRQNARVFISSRDSRPAAPTPAAANASVATPVMAQPPMPGASAETRARYLETARDPARYARFDAFIREAAALYQLPEALLRAVIRQESDFNPFSVSSSGALGLMQLLPSTAASMTVQDPFDPRQNILGGARYLRVLANTFNGDLILTLAAYNAGSGAVIRYGTVPPYDETQHYVRQVIRYYYQYRAQG